MKKFLIALALIATPALAQQTEEVNYYARDFPQWAEQDKGSAVERSYNEFMKASQKNAKFLATCKTCKPEPKKITIPAIRIPKDNTYAPICAYGTC